MRRLVLLGLIVGLSASLGAQLRATKETLTIAASSVGLASATVSGMTNCLGVLETAAVRMWTDGSDPTASVGILVQPGSTISLQGSQTITLARFIRTASTSASLAIQCVP